MKIPLERFPQVTSILRGYTLEEIDHILQVLCESKIRSVEITYNTPHASEILRHAVQRYGDRMLFGAGTVTTMEALAEVVDAGANFVLSPTAFTPEMLHYCQEHQVVSVPGAFSPSEIAQQFSLGADIVKVFPAITVGPAYFHQLAGPMGQQPLMAVGGINSKNAREFLDTGAKYLGIGSGMFLRQDVQAGDLDAMWASVAEFETALGL